MSDNEERSFSKKIIFLYPHSVIQDQMVTLLIQSEFEVVLLNDYQKASSLVYKYPSSILFINIEAELEEPVWEQYIRTLLENKAKHDVRIGLLTYNPTPELAQKYLIDIGVQCGFIALKLGLTESARIILKMLEANEAKGTRKFVRVRCPPGKTTLNVHINDRTIKGTILDLSSAGMACLFDSDIPVKTEMNDIQMVLWGGIVKVSGRIMGVRQQDDGQNIHVIMYSETIAKEMRGKIYTFIRKVLQAEVDAPI